MQRSTLQLHSTTPFATTRSFPSTFLTKTTPLLKTPTSTYRSRTRTPLNVRNQVATPPEVYAKLVDSGEERAKLPFLKLCISSLMAGTYIALGGLLCLSVGGACPELVQTNPGLCKIITGIFGLPFGLFLVLLTGVELFTGNTAFLTAAFLEERVSMGELMTNWVVSYIFNFIGVMMLIYILSQCGIVGTPSAQQLAMTKTSFTFSQAFVRGILANWCVCLAVWSATAASSLPGKVLGVFIPISSFVSMGFEHSIANMFLIPFGIFAGASVSFNEFLIRNLIPVTLGNIIGGSLLVGAFGSMMFGKLGKAKVLSE